MEELQLHILVTPKKEHKKVFPNVLVIGFRNGKFFKDYFVKATLLILNESGRRCKPCKEKLVWSAKAFKVQSGPQNCDSKKVLNLLKCKACVEVPYVEKAKTKFRYRPNNYKSKHRAFRKGNRRNYSTFTIDSMATEALKFENL